MPLVTRPRVADSHAHRLSSTPAREQPTKTPFAARAAALGLSFVVTLVKLGSMDYLATLEPQAAAVMAAASQPRG